jgi:uncharacterized protein YbcI
MTQVLSNHVVHRSDTHLKTQGEIQAAICERIASFEQDRFGRGPKEIRAHLIGDLVLVRLYNVLTPTELQIVKAKPIETGRTLLKQVRTHLIESARPLFDAMIEDVTGIQVLSLHHDISTTSGEEVLVFTLAEAPRYREPSRKFATN